MNLSIIGDEELPLLCDNTKIIAIDSLEPWQTDQLLCPNENDSLSQANSCLQNVDLIVSDWLKDLTPQEWNKIKRQRSLYGIKLPEKWIVVWRIILKEPNLRDSERATRGGRAIGSYSHLWNIWSEECLDKYLSPMEKHLLALVDSGLLYSEIGEIMLTTYGDEFWKKRKENTKTTPSQVVNNYLYWKMPNGIARKELTDTVLNILERMEREEKEKSQKNPS